MADRRLEWILANGPCSKCGSTSDLEVDHIDRSTKVTHKVWSWAKDKRLAELAKCQVLCKKCHLDKTIIENTKPFTHGTVAGYTKGCRCAECKVPQMARVYAWRAKVGGRKANK